MTRKKRIVSKDVEQIHHECWGNGGEEYWRDITCISEFIAARLQYPLPRCNGRVPRMSTIVVEQYKEKFGDVRIYCTLAHEGEVAKAWAEKKGFPTDEEPSSEFVKECFERDARVYRSAYIDMINLVPQYKRAIKSCATYDDLLYDSFEDLCALFDADSALLEENPLRCNLTTPYLVNRYRCFGVTTFDSLREFFKKIYE